MSKWLMFPIVPERSSLGWGGLLLCIAILAFLLRVLALRKGVGNEL